MTQPRTYPPDEFDVDVVPDGPRGVHRAPRSALSRWAPFLVVLVVVPALAFALVSWLSTWEGRPDVDLPVFGDAPTSSQTPTPDEEEPEPDAGTGDEETPSPDPEPEETEEPEPEPDLARDVEVYNATRISGLAAGAAEELQAAGFTQVTTGNWAAADPPSSIVYYPDEADAGTARAVADALGITETELAPDRSGAVVVAVLLEDYAD